MVERVLRVPKIGVVPPRELSFLPDSRGEIPLVEFMRGAIPDHSSFFWAVFQHILLTAGNTFSSEPYKGETRHNIESSFPDPFGLLTVLSQITSKNDLFTAVIPATQMPLGDLAQRYASISNLSNGRLWAGLAAAWSEDEHKALGYGDIFHHRGEILDQKIPALEMVLSGIPVNLHIGREHIRNMGINPGTKHRVRICIGGGLGPLDNPNTISVLRRAAMYGDMYMPMGDVGPFIERKPIILKYLEEFGRNPSDYGFMGRITLGRKPIDECVDDLLAWIKAGATHVALTTVGQMNGDWKFHQSLVSDFLAASEWIRNPNENIEKTIKDFTNGYYRIAPEETITTKERGLYRYSYLKREINSRFLDLRLRQLGFDSVGLEGEPREVFLIYHEDMAFRERVRYRLGDQELIVFDRSKEREETVLFYN